MKKGLSKISIILVALFAVTMITVLLIGTGIFNTPKQAAKKTLNSVKQILIKNVKAREKRVEDIIKNKVHLEGEADFKIDFPEKSQEILADFGVDKLIKALNDYTYEINATTDMKNDKANLVLGIKNQEGKKICFETLYNNKETYLNIEDVTDGYVDLEKNLDLFKYIKNYKTNKLSKSLDNFFEIIKNELKDEYFIESKEKITVEGKEIDVTKTALSMTEKQLLDYLVEVVETIKVDETIMQYMVSVNEDSTREDIISKLDESISNIRKILTNDDKVLEIAVYKKSAFAKPIRYIVSSSRSSKQYTTKSSSGLEPIIIVTDYKTKEYSRKIELAGINIMVKEKFNNNYKIVFDIEDIKGELEGTIKKSNIDIKYNITVSQDTENISGQLKFINKRGIIKYLISYDVASGVNAGISFDGKYKTNYNKEIKDVEDVLPIETLESKDVRSRLDLKSKELGTNEVNVLYQMYIDSISNN